MGKKQKSQGNRYESEFTKWALVHTSGLHPDVKGIATSTGRVGNYANLEIDGVFIEYSLEAKSKTSKLPKWFSKGFYQAIQASKRFKNTPLVCFYLKELPKGYRRWHFITAERHVELLKYEKLAWRMDEHD
jgi:hypothetical protein